ncbi:hypothetical protein BDN72DRAFT_850896, partial [Pluteus cervinus]
KLDQPLTKAEWLAQSDEVQHTWAEKILHRGWASSCRRRIADRKQSGRKQAGKEVAAFFHPYDRRHDLTREDTLSALLNGEEKLGVWTMKCIGYDANIQRTLIKKIKTWVPP